MAFWEKKAKRTFNARTYILNFRSQKILLLLQFLAFASGSDQPGTMRPSGIFDVIHHMLTYLPSRLLTSMNIKGKGPMYRNISNCSICFNVDSYFVKLTYRKNEKGLLEAQ